MSRRMNHGIVSEELEDHLDGKASRAFYDHVGACPECAAMVASFDDVSHAVRGLKASAFEVPEVPFGFYNRVTTGIVETGRKDRWGNLFSPGEAFFRKIAFASLLVLAGLGAVLATHTPADPGRDAVSIIAQHDPTSPHGESTDRDRLLVTLTSYDQ